MRPQIRDRRTQPRQKAASCRGNMMKKGNTRFAFGQFVAAA
jgi:hypothetical protein